ncbi:MAG: DUF3857 and transglutaminase domain-containing protein [Chitinophagaceae bacterium]
MTLLKPTLYAAFALAAAVIFCSSAVSAQIAGFIPGNKYSALSIPNSLRKDADIVMREDARHFKIKDVNSAVLEVHEIFTVLNADAKDRLTFYYTSDKFDYLDDAEIKVYNALGSLINTYSKKEMQTEAYGEGLVEDGKTTYFRVTAPSYPITVERTYTVKYKGILDYPDDNIQNPYTSVEHFVYSVEVPNELGLRYKTVNCSIKPEITDLKEAKSYTWETRNLTAKKSEKHNGGSSRYSSAIMIAPNKFKLDDFEGDMTSWKNFGEWNYNLIGQRNKLSDKGTSFMQSLVKEATTDEAKARLIYSYLQKNMRYVSIQLGIGGWRPFPADFVQEKKYGDCKALSNYMQAALDAAGVKSYYAVVNAGTNEEAAADDFPTSRFNHIILCIPQPEDSIWLECTSTTSDFGELGDFTENRKAMLVTEKGGVLVNTPKSRAAANVFTSTTHIHLNDDGTGKAETIITGTGEFKQQQVAWTYQQSDDEKRNYLVKAVDWKQPDVVTVTNGSRFEKPYRIEAKMEYDQLPSFKAGSKMFLQPRLYPLFDEDVPDNDKRTQDYFFDRPYQAQDTTVFHLPEGFAVENLPKEKNISYPFGKYSSHYAWNETTKLLTVIAALEITQHEIKAATYPELVEFRKAVDADMNEKIVVKKM